jgi:hypothetical protein
LKDGDAEDATVDINCVQALFNIVISYNLESSAVRAIGRGDNVIMHACIWVDLPTLILFTSC